MSAEKFVPHGSDRHWWRPIGAPDATCLSCGCTRRDYRRLRRAGMDTRCQSIRDDREALR